MAARCHARRRGALVASTGHRAISADGPPAALGALAPGRRGWAGRCPPDRPRGGGAAARPLVGAGLGARGHRRHPRCQPGGVMGGVELLGVRGQGRLPRVPGTDDHDDQDRPHERLRQGDVGILLRSRPLRHADGADAPALLDQWLHREPGGAVLRVVGDSPVPLLDPGGGLERTF